MFKRALSAEQIRRAYEKVLSREADAKEISWRSGQRLSLGELYEALLDTEEFGLKHGNVLQTVERMYAANLPVEVDVDPVTRDALLARIVGQWRKIGEADTYWSIWPSEAYKRENVRARDIDAMFASGQHIRRLIEAFEQKTRRAIPRGRCFELGCGVGRETHVLAGLFESVLAAEVSTGALNVCGQQMRSRGIDNVELRTLTKLDDFDPNAPYDLFYANQVLEHNPAPVQKAILETALGQLKEGGFCIFNTPAYLHDYRFNAKEYLVSKIEVLDLHCLPTADTLRILDDLGINVLDFLPDGALTQFGSIMYFGQKRRADQPTVHGVRFSA